MLETQRRNRWIDLLFPLAHSFLLFGLPAVLILPAEARPGKILIILLCLSFLAGLLHWVENGLLLATLSQNGGAGFSLIRLSSLIATTK